jgi:hypothetical protein
MKPSPPQARSSATPDLVPALTARAILAAAPTEAETIHGDIAIEVCLGNA